MRRGVIVGVLVGVALLLGSFVALTQRVVAELRAEAARSGEMFAKAARAAYDPNADAQSVLLEVYSDIIASKVPVIVTDAQGNPTAIANLPFASASDPGVREWIPRLDAQNEPILLHSLGAIQFIHFGHTPLVRGLQIIPTLQVGTLVLFLLAGAYALRVRAHAERERVWAGMARESAHQLGTPLSSLSGWVELLREREGDPLTARAVEHMAADCERLERVAHRFERIGRPPHKQELNVATIVDRVARYFRARVPSLAHTVAIETQHEPSLPVEGDAVLIEWAIEALVKNAVDALAGKGGTIVIEGSRLPEGDIRIRVIDDGPGVPRELRRRIFEAGFSTKRHGWGIGLGLARRIIEEAHGGSLALLPTNRGATFEIIFPA
jgi:signal transduction histidine kinase